MPQINYPSFPKLKSLAEILTSYHPVMSNSFGLLRLNLPVSNFVLLIYLLTVSHFFQTPDYGQYHSLFL